jgi:hypothetical protein
VKPRNRQRAPNSDEKHEESQKDEGSSSNAWVGVFVPFLCSFVAILGMGFTVCVKNGFGKFPVAAGEFDRTVGADNLCGGAA